MASNAAASNVDAEYGMGMDLDEWEHETQTQSNQPAESKQDGAEPTGVAQVKVNESASERACITAQRRNAMLAPLSLSATLTSSHYAVRLLAVGMNRANL